MKINLTLATTAARTQMLVDGDKTPSEVLSENNVATTGATISMNMRVLPVSDLTETFESLGCNDGDSVMLSAVVKADSAF